MEQAHGLVIFPNMQSLANLKLWPEGKMPGYGAKEAEVSRNNGFYRIANVSWPTLTLFPAS
jgi:hypothetical protein